jgi:hypothetical protein
MAKKKQSSTLIKNFGLRWERKFVNWGAGSVRGHLNGIKRGNKKRVVDFRKQIGIYVLQDVNFDPVYIGQVGRGENKSLLSRLKNHRSGDLSGRWHYFSWFGFKRANPGNGRLSNYDKVKKQFRASGRVLLDQFEGLLIAVAEPRFNRQGARWAGTEQYMQQVDDRVRDMTVDDLFEHQERLAESVNKILRAVVPPKRAGRKKRR